MSIRVRPSKLEGVADSYEVRIGYTDFAGNNKSYSKTFRDYQEAFLHEKEKRKEIKQYGMEYRFINKTVKEVYEEYLKVQSGVLTEGTLKGYQFTYNLYLKDQIESMLINELVKEKRIAIIDSLSTYNVQRNAKKILNGIIRFAEERGYKYLEKIEHKEMKSDYDPMIIVTKLREPPSKYSPHYKETCFNREAYAMALLLQYKLDLPLTIVLAISKSDVDLSDKQIIIKNKLVYNSSKIKKNDLKLEKLRCYYTVNIPDEIMDQLSIWMNENKNELLICDYKGKMIHPHALNVVKRCIVRSIRNECD